MTCVRKAWLVLGARTVQLEGKGYGCTSLDLGSPDIRDVTDNLPDMDGIEDRTLYMGGRTVTADITALAPAARIDDVASKFAPFMAPSARPVLHYILDRSGEAERTLTLRPSGYSWPIVGPYQRDIHLSWVAADPIARDPTVEQSTAWSGSTVQSGRQYNLTFPRTYPQGGGSQITGDIVTAGDVAVRPLLRIFGPITQATVTFRRHSDNSVCGVVAMVAGYVIPQGTFVEIDTKARTAWLNGNRQSSVLHAVAWAAMQWPVIPIAPDGASMVLTADMAGGVTAGVTQVQATWQDGYLS